MSTSLTTVLATPVTPTAPTFTAAQMTWSKMLQGGFKPGELAIWSAGMRSGKSMLMAKMMMKSVYGSFGDAVPHNVSVSKAYKGEWRVCSTYSTDIDIRQWLHDTLGDPGRDRRYRWRANNTKFGVYFLRHESDLLMFRLRWM